MSKDKVGNYMTTAPITVKPETPLAEAIETMRGNNIRHLPVVSENSVVGLLSEREITRFEAFLNTRDLYCKDVMAANPFIVTQGTSLKDVLKQMEATKFGSVIVTSRTGDIMGIFTTIDAVRILAGMLDDDDDFKVQNIRYIEDYFTMGSAAQA